MVLTGLACCSDTHARTRTHTALRHPWLLTGGGGGGGANTTTTTAAAEDVKAAAGETVHPQVLVNLRSFHSSSMFQKMLLEALTYSTSVVGSGKKRDIESMAETFRALDLDGDGLISFDELKEGLGKVGWVLSSFLLSVVPRDQAPTATRVIECIIMERTLGRNNSWLLA